MPLARPESSCYTCASSCVISAFFSSDHHIYMNTRAPSSAWRRILAIGREHAISTRVNTSWTNSDRIVKLQQCRTNKMVADALTKNLPAPVFEQHRATMLGEDEAPFSAMLCRVRD